MPEKTECFEKIFKSTVFLTVSFGSKGIIDIMSAGKAKFGEKAKFMVDKLYFGALMLRTLRRRMAGWTRVQIL